MYGFPGIPLVITSAYTDVNGNEIILEFNKSITDPAGSENDFAYYTDAVEFSIDSVKLMSDAALTLYCTDTIEQLQTVLLTYDGNSITSTQNDHLMTFTNLSVINNTFNQYVKFTGSDKPDFVSSVQTLWTDSIGDVGQPVSCLTGSTSDPRIFFDVVPQQDLSLIRYITLRIKRVSGTWDGHIWIYDTQGAPHPNGSYPSNQLTPAPNIGEWAIVTFDLAVIDPPALIRDIRIDFNSGLGCVVLIDWAQFSTTP